MAILRMTSSSGRVSKGRVSKGVCIFLFLLWYAGEDNCNNILCTIASEEDCDMGTWLWRKAAKTPRRNRARYPKRENGSCERRTICFWCDQCFSTWSIFTGQPVNNYNHPVCIYVTGSGKTDQLAQAIIYIPDDRANNCLRIDMLCLVCTYLVPCLSYDSKLCPLKDNAHSKIAKLGKVR